MTEARPRATQLSPRTRETASRADAATVNSEKVGSVATYVVVTLILLVLTAVNVAVAYLDLRGFNSVVSLAIASVEVIIMALFFMNLRWSAPMTRLVSLAGLFWLGILLVGTMDDVLTRGWLPVPGK